MSAADLATWLEREKILIALAGHRWLPTDPEEGLMVEEMLDFRHGPYDVHLVATDWLDESGQARADVTDGRQPFPAVALDTRKVKDDDVFGRPCLEAAKTRAFELAFEIIHEFEEGLHHES